MIFRMASIYFDAYLGKTYGALHTMFQMIILAVIVGYSFGAAIILSPAQNPMLSCGWAGQTYSHSSESSDPMARSREERLFWSRQEPLDKFCQKCNLMLAWLCLISL
jgi:hypothetical protein